MKLADLKIGVEYVVIHVSGAFESWQEMKSSSQFGAPGWLENSARRVGLGARRMRLDQIRVPVTDPVTRNKISSGLRMTDVSTGKPVETHPRYVVATWEDCEKLVQTRSAEHELSLKGARAVLDRHGITLTYAASRMGAIVYTLDDVPYTLLDAYAASRGTVANRYSNMERGVHDLKDLIAHLRKGYALLPAAHHPMLDQAMLEGGRDYQSGVTVQARGSAEPILQITNLAYGALQQFVTAINDGLSVEPPPVRLADLMDDEERLAHHLRHNGTASVRLAGDTRRATAPKYLISVHLDQEPLGEMWLDDDRWMFRHRYSPDVHVVATRPETGSLHDLQVFFIPKTGKIAEVMRERFDVPANRLGG